MGAVKATPVTILFTIIDPDSIQFPKPSELYPSGQRQGIPNDPVSYDEADPEAIVQSNEGAGGQDTKVTQISSTFILADPPFPTPK
jgi:hypothetical protein